MSTADIVILCIILLPTIVGAIYGFLNIIFSLLSWIISLGLAVKLTPHFSPLLNNYIDSDMLRVALAFIVLFIICLLIMSGFCYFIVKLLGRTGLTATDRFLGLFFGMGLGGLIVTVVVFLAGFTTYPEDVWWKESKLIKPFELVSVWSKGYLGESIEEYHAYEKTSKND